MSTISISASVGLNAANKPADVMKVQAMLNHFIGNKKLLGYKALVLDGKCGAKTREAIMAFQFQNGLVSEEHFKCQVYARGNTIAFMNKNAGYIPTWEVGREQGPTLLQLLWDVDTDQLSEDETKQKHLGRLRRFFIRALEGEAIDDSYWTFTYFRGMGMNEYLPHELGYVDSVKRADMKQRALSVFRTNAKATSSKDDVASALRHVDKRLWDNVNVLLRWHVGHSAVSEGTLKDFTEMAYLREIALLAVRSTPESVYAVYIDEIVARYRVMRPILTADVRWQMRQSGR